MPTNLSLFFGGGCANGVDVQNPVTVEEAENSLNNVRRHFEDLPEVRTVSGSGASRFIDPGVFGESAVSGVT